MHSWSLSLGTEPWRFRHTSPQGAAPSLRQLSGTLAYWCIKAYCWILDLVTNPLGHLLFIMQVFLGDRVLKMGQSLIPFVLWVQLFLCKNPSPWGRQFIRSELADPFQLGLGRSLSLPLPLSSPGTILVAMPAIKGSSPSLEASLHPKTCARWAEG